MACQLLYWLIILYVWFLKRELAVSFAKTLEVCIISNIIRAEHLLQNQLYQSFWMVCKRCEICKCWWILTFFKCLKNSSSPCHCWRKVRYHVIVSWKWMLMFFYHLMHFFIIVEKEATSNVSKDSLAGMIKERDQVLIFRPLLASHFLKLFLQIIAKVSLTHLFASR